VEGKALETDVNETGPGEAYFVRCDVSVDRDIKVKNLHDYDFVKKISKYAKCDSEMKFFSWKHIFTILIIL